MATQRIRLHAIGPDLEGRVWESENSLRIGRAPDAEVTLPDSSLSRRHAEVTRGRGGWVVRDLNSRNGTFVNGVRVGGVDRPLNPRDVLQCGNVVLLVALGGNEPQPANETQVGSWRVQGTARQSWDEALRELAMNATRRTAPGEQLASLLGAGQYLARCSSYDDILRLSLRDAAEALQAERGALLLPDADAGKLVARATFRSEEAADALIPYSTTLARRCFGRGESMLCNDVRTDAELLDAGSIPRSGMTSVICALVRSTAKHLGVLQLGRGPNQPPFTLNDLRLADALAVGMSGSVVSAQVLYEKQRNVFLQTAVTLAQTLELRDPFTSGHSQRVTEYVLLMANECNLSAAERQLLQVAGPVHDIGKLGVDDAVLHKAGPLTDREYEEVKSHSTKGATLIQSVPELTEVAQIIRSHHERWDGKGYPDGLKGEAIPRVARLIAVADAFDVLTFATSYHEALPTDVAFRRIEQDAGTHFDPGCVEAFRRARPQIRERLRQQPAPAVDTVYTRTAPTVGV